MISFDGDAWTHYLEGHCGGSKRLAIAEDGSVWVTSTSWPDEPQDPGAENDIGLYVITPEAVAATE